MIHEVTSLPRSVEDLTQEWLHAALGRRFPRLTVISYEIVQIIWGTATKVRIKLRYADPEVGSLSSPPEFLCVKSCLDERVKGLADPSLYVLETRFYDHFTPLAGDLNIALPHAWYAAIDVLETQGILILDDLGEGRVRFGEPGGRTYTPEEVATGLQTLARWHSATWGGKLARLPWLRVGGATRRVAANLLTESYWNQHFSLPDAPKLPVPLQDRGRIQAGLNRMWAMADGAVTCLNHGDAHVGNTYIDAQGHVGFIDWQSVGLAPYADDVAYFIGGSLSIQDRRKHERALIGHYLEALAEYGGPQIDPGAAWSDYIKHSMHGFLWALTPSVFQPMERVVAMADRYIAAMLDHEVLESLGV